MSSLGQIGEKLAAKYLESKGYRTLMRNELMVGIGEVDLICRSPSGALALVEVKTMRIRSGGLEPEDNLSVSKLGKMRRAGQMFSAKHPDLVWEQGIQLDVVTVAVPDTLLTYDTNNCIIKHYENVGD